MKPKATLASLCAFSATGAFAQIPPFAATWRCSIPCGPERPTAGRMVRLRAPEMTPPSMTFKLYTP